MSQQQIQWRFRECGNHFHVEIDVDGHTLPGGTLTRGCCWPTAHKLERTREGYKARPTSAESVVIALLSDCVPARTLGSALGHSAAYYQHSISGTSGAPPLDGTWKRKRKLFTETSFPSVGIAETKDGTICPLLIVGLRGGDVNAIPLINWPREGAKDIVAGHEVLAVPAWAVSDDKQAALSTCQAKLANQTSAEAIRENLARILGIIHPHELADPDYAPIYVASLLHEHLVADRTGKFDRECKEILDTLLAPNGEPYDSTLAGMYLAYVRYFQQFTQPIRDALRTNDYDAAAAQLDLENMARIIVCLLDDLQTLQHGLTPYPHRGPNALEDFRASFLMPEEDVPGDAQTIIGRKLEFMARILEYISITLVRHPITDPQGAVMQAIKEWMVKTSGGPNLRPGGRGRRQ